MKRERRSELAGLWQENRRQQITTAKKFFYGFGVTDALTATGPPRVVFVVNEARRAGMTTFLRELRGDDAEALVISCGNDPGADPVFEALLATVWRLLVRDEQAWHRFVEALEIHSDLIQVPTANDIRRMVEVGGRTSRDLAPPPRRLRVLLPEEFRDLANIVNHTADRTSARRFFIDDAIITDSITLRGAIHDVKAPACRFAIGTQWTKEGMQLLSGWMQHRHDRVGVWTLSEPPRKEVVRDPPPDPFRSIFFTVDRSKDASSLASAQMQFNEMMAAFFARAIAALDGIRREDVADVAALLHTDDTLLQQLLANEELFIETEGRVRMRTPWTHQGTLENLISFVEELLAQRTDVDVDAARTLLRIARTDAKQMRGDRLAAPRAILLSVVAKYVRSVRIGDQGETATAADLLARQLRQNTEPGPRHLILLDELFRDCANLSIVDHGLLLLSSRDGAPISEEFRFLRTACAAARRYSDKLIATVLAELLPSPRMCGWVVPADIDLAGRALNEIWKKREVMDWIARFEQRLLEFALTPEEMWERIRASEKTEEPADGVRIEIGRSERKRKRHERQRFAAARSRAHPGKAR